MTQQSAPTAVILPGPPPAAPTWRQRYWAFRTRTRRAWQELTVARRLKDLRRQADAAPRGRPGTIALDGWRIAYDDLPALYTEYKHIFTWGIYDFQPRRPRPRILDCGAHIGMSVMRFKRIAPDCRIVAFEPGSGALKLLHENIRRNDIAGVEVVPAALARSQGTAQFVADGADGGALTQEGYTPPSAYEVETVPLSAYLDEPIEMLKMNIEGVERDVLFEAADKLHNVQHMVIEYHGFPETGQKLHEILALLHDCGFRYLIHHLDYEANRQVRPPFRIREGTRFYLLIAATRLWEAGNGKPSQPAVQVNAGSNEPVDVAQTCEPISRKFGCDRGHPIDRRYIEDFLDAHRADVRGRVLEVGDPGYTKRFGGGDVTHSDVLNVHNLPGTTIVGDLTEADNIPTAAYDCFILTQTLPVIYDVRAALQNAHRILKPGGVLLLTVPGISQRSHHDAQRWGDYWRFTPHSVYRLLTEVFDSTDVTVRTYGNMRAATALLDGRAAHELPAEVLNYLDEDYPMIMAARAVRRA